MGERIEEMRADLDDMSEVCEGLAAELAEMRRTAPFNRDNPHYIMPEKTSEEMEQRLDEMCERLEGHASYLMFFGPDDDDDDTPSPKPDDQPSRIAGNVLP